MTSKKKYPPKWTEVYQNDIELEIFICLIRQSALKGWKFRSLAQIAKQVKISKELAEEILYKYWDLGIVFQNPVNEDQWAYWEIVPELLPEEEISVAEEDHNLRIESFKKRHDM